MSRLLYTFICTRAAGAYSLPFPIPGHLLVLASAAAGLARRHVEACPELAEGGGRVPVSESRVPPLLLLVVPAVI